MMKKRLIIVAMGLFLCSVQNTLAEDHFYGQLGAYQFMNVDDFDDEQSFGALVGYSFADSHSVEFEFQVNGFDSDDPGFEVDADLLTYLLNYRYTFYRTAHWGLNARVGAGFSQPEFGTSSTTRGEDSIWVWHAGLGAEYSFGGGFYAAGDVRVQQFGEMEDDGVSYDVGTPIVIGLAVGYKF